MPTFQTLLLLLAVVLILRNVIILSIHRREGDRLRQKARKRMY